MASGKKILITAGRSPITLDLARQLNAAGHEIYITETSRFHLCSFSNAVKKNFIIPSPRFEPKNFLDALTKIVKDEKIDMLIPAWEEVLNISMNLDLFPPECDVFCSPFKLLHTLHNKWLFMQRLSALGLPTPETQLVEKLADLETLDFGTSYVLKPCYSRASQKIRKVNPNDPLPIIDIESHNPWVAQEWLEGNKYCTYSVCHNGEVNAHGIYPVEYSIEGNSCLTFRSIEHKKILDWIKYFVKSQNFTGQIGFDFIETEDGTIYPIECNPRSTSGAHLFRTEDQIDRAFLNTTTETICPPVGRSKQFAAGMIFYGWKALPTQTGKSEYLNQLLFSKDVVFEFSDLVPFFSQPLLAVKYFLISRKLQEKLYSTFYYDLDWNGESELSFPPGQQKVV